MKNMVLASFLIILLGCGGGGDPGPGTATGTLPVVTIQAATSITDNGTTLNGSVIPNGSPTQCWFEYGTDPSLNTYDNIAIQPVGSGIDTRAITGSLTGLLPGTTYYCRVCASNSFGLSRSTIASFATSSFGSCPAVFTLASVSVTNTGATLNGSVTPNGLATNAWFEWGTDPGLATYSSTSTQPLGSGMTSILASDSLSGLSTGTTYYFRVAANNSSGTSRGVIASLIPGSAPSTTTLAATSITATGGTLNGNVTPNGLATDAWFAWGTDSTLSTCSTTAVQSMGAGSTAQGASIPLTGLTTGTTYYYRVYAHNSTGTSWGTIVSFTPSLAPSVTTLPPTSVTATGATLNGSVTPNGLATNAWFEWGTDPGLATYSPTAAQSAGAGVAGQAISAVLTGRTIGMPCYYRIAASNAWGTTRGTIASFTPVAAPSAATRATSFTTATGATFNGTVNPNGLPTTAWFEWGTDPGLAPNATTPQDAGSGINAVSAAQAVDGLPGGTLHYYRVVARNDAGTVRGNINWFYVTSSVVSQKSTSYQINPSHDGHATFGQPLVFQVSESWHVTLPDTASYPVIADGKVFVTKRSSGGGGYGTQLYALDLATGAIAWGPVTIAGTYFRSGHAYNNGKIFVINYNGLLQSFDASTGTAGWSVSLSGLASSFAIPPVVGNEIVYVTGSSRLIAVDEATGTVLWYQGANVGSQSSPTLSEDGVFVNWNKFDPGTGTPLWSSPSGSTIKFTAAYAGGRLFVRDILASPVGSVVNAGNGSQLATYGTNSMLSIPASDGSSVYMNAYGTLQALDPATMAVRWSFAGDGHLTSAPLLIDNMVIVGSSTGTVYAVNAATGAQQWAGSAGAGISGPDEWNVSGPLTGIGAGEGYLVVSAGSTVTAWHIAGR